MFDFTDRVVIVTGAAGNLGSAVARVIASRRPVPMEFIAVKDAYAKSGAPAELLERYGLTAGAIEQAVSRLLDRKAG